MTCDTSHGWVKPRDDGARAKCGGPDICPTCQTEKMHDSMLTACFGPCSNSRPAPARVAAAGDAGDAQDAARYRALHWMAADPDRLQAVLTACNTPDMAKYTPDDLNALADAAIAASQQGKEGEA